MNKLKLYFSAFLLAMVICLSGVAVKVNAAPEGIPYVSDRAGILQENEREKLEELAQEVSERQQCGVYIVTVDDYQAYSTEGVLEAAKFIYKTTDLGYGEDKDGELLLLSMADRDYALIAYGYGNTAFTDYGKSYLEKKFLDDFGDDEWYDGLKDYIDQSDEMLSMARNGKPMDVGYETTGKKIISVLISAILGLITALVVGGILKGQLKSVYQKAEAGEYVEKDGIEITSRRDRFINRTVTRRKIEKKSSSGGTSVGSDGFSGSSGKF